MDAHWLVGALPAMQLGARAAPQDPWASHVFHDVANSLDLHATDRAWPLRVVPRSPTFVALKRPAHLPPAPNGSLYIDRPQRQLDPKNCLRTRAPGLRTRPLTKWTLELVVLFLPSRHFGRAWQTVIGRNGANFTRNRTVEHANFASLYLKLCPENLFRLEAWTDYANPPVNEKRTDDVFDAASGGRIKFSAITSRRGAQPNKWYSVVASMDGELMKLYINGELEGVTRVYGGMRMPPRAIDGDTTLGCGMYAGDVSDVCSCLITEARVSESVRDANSWLWGPPWLNPKNRIRRTATT